MHIPETILDLILMNLSGDISDEGKQQLEEWLAQPEHLEEYRKYQIAWLSGKWEQEVRSVSTEQAWKSLCNRRKRRKLLWYPGVAAAIVIFILGGLIFYAPSSTEDLCAQSSLSSVIQSKAYLVLASGEQLDLTAGSATKVQLEAGMALQIDSVSLVYQEPLQQEYIEVTWNRLLVPVGGEYQLQLPDGSRVILNSASELKFPVRFAPGIREVHLTGEAYFQIQKDTARPFVVYTDKTAVRVLGTEFNVLAYPEETETQITLVEGRVEVRVSEVCDSLSPGFQFVLNNSALQGDIRKVDVRRLTAWKDGLFYFDGMPLDLLMKRLSRWYDIGYEFREEELKQLHFSGGFRKEETLGTILEIIQKITPVKFRMEDKTIVVTR